MLYLRCAPKFVRFLLAAVSFSLSSWSTVFFFDLFAFLPAVADVGVGWFEAPSRNAADEGVTPEAGVEPPDPGAIPSRLFGRYEMDDLENTRFCSIVPVLRRCAAAPLVPFM